MARQSEPSPKQWQWLTIVLMLALVVTASAYWYKKDRPTANLKETIGAIGRPDAMTPEAIAEGGSSIIGRNVSVTDAEVTGMMGDRTFWIKGSDGQSLLVLALPAGADGVNVQVVPELETGDRVQVNGVVRDGPQEGLSARDQAQLKRASVYLVASEVLRAPKG